MRMSEYRTARSCSQSRLSAEANRPSSHQSVGLKRSRVCGLSYALIRIQYVYESIGLKVKVRLRWQTRRPGQAIQG